MADVLRVRERHSGQRVAENLDCSIEWKQLTSSGFIAKRLPERAPVHILHDDKRFLLFLKDIVDMNDIGVDEARVLLSLRYQNRDVVVGADSGLFQKPLKRHIAVELLVGCFPDRRLATCAQNFMYDVAAFVEFGAFPQDEHLDSLGGV